MLNRILNSLSMSKYTRLLPRLFPGAVRIQVRDRQDRGFWSISDDQDERYASSAEHPWADIGGHLQRRDGADGELQFRAALRTREYGRVAWLVVSYDASISVPLATAPDALKRAFADAVILLQEDIELQSECNQLAAELSERYEELNLVYSTQDQVEYFEEGQEALVRLVHNCADYLDVGLAALVSRDRNLSLHSVNQANAPAEVDSIIELISTSVYDHVESQVGSVVLNEADDTIRRRLLGGRTENILAYPIIDDHGTAVGLLAVVAQHDKHTFSNGDRNLLEVMAKKASRIIHTHHDSLTGLMNRSGFESSLVAALGNARSGNVTHSLLHIDIDQVHVVNDLMGHQEGDGLIRRVAKLIRSIVRESDFVSRLGGDEFGALLSNCDADQGQAVAEKIRDAVNQLRVVSANRQLDVSVSIGVAVLDREADGIAGIMAAAEIACKAAKDDGRDRIQFFREDNTALVQRSEEIGWIGRVQEALRSDSFALYCQPVTPLDANRAAHFEILVRMLDDDGSILPPASFMPAAERYQLMPLVDRWVIRNTLRSLGRTWERFAAASPVFCINLSGQSLTHTGFLAFIRDELNYSGVPPENICFEITETAAISNIDEALEFMNELRSVGCRFALDDFGAGLSSFGYLKVLPVNYLKIDGSFVREVTTDRTSLSMVTAICQIGKAMGLALVAEYVGDAETQAVLGDIGVDYVQGFYIGKPAPLAEITDELRDRAKAVS